MSMAAQYLIWLEDELKKVEQERKVTWLQWLALGRVVYFLLKERVKHEVRDLQK